MKLVNSPDLLTPKVEPICILFVMSFFQSSILALYFSELILELKLVFCPILALNYFWVKMEQKGISNYTVSGNINSSLLDFSVLFIIYVLDKSEKTSSLKTSMEGFSGQN